MCYFHFFCDANSFKQGTCKQLCTVFQDEVTNSFISDNIWVI